MIAAIRRLAGWLLERFDAFPLRKLLLFAAGLVAGMLFLCAVVVPIALLVSTHKPEFGTVADLATADRAVAHLRFDDEVLFELTAAERATVLRLMTQMSLEPDGPVETCEACLKDSSDPYRYEVWIDFSREQAGHLGYRAFRFRGPPFVAAINRPSGTYPDGYDLGQYGQAVLTSDEVASVARLIAASTGWEPEEIVASARCTEDCFATGAGGPMMTGARSSGDR